MNRRRFLLAAGAAASVGLFGRRPLAAQVAAPGPVSPAANATPAGALVRPPAGAGFRELRRNVGVFTARGGSIGWLVNADAVAAVDTQFPETAEIFLRDLPGREGRSLDVVVNTHHHGDHTGGNATLRPVARTIVAHANVPELLHRRAAADGTTVNPATVPDATFADAWRLTLGDEVVSARYFGPAHTRGDIVVFFERANVVHVGDLLFNRLYPVIDRPGGASIRGWIALLEKIAVEYPPDAFYLCGHGNPVFGVVAGPPDLLAFRDYLSALLAHVGAALEAGRSKEEVMQLENLPGFPEYHVPPGRGNRLPANLSVAFDELTAG